MNVPRGLRLILAALCLATPGMVLAGDAPVASLYGLAVDLETQDAKAVKLSSFAGAPLIVAMFYTSCGYACPLIINNVKSLERRLEEGERQAVRVLLVSFDPDTDTPELLKKTALKHGVDPRRWTLARASASDVENLAAVLGIKYKKLDAQTINHTSVITVVAPDGQILKRTEQFGSDVDALVAALKAQR